MKFVPITCLVLVFATPASAVPQWVEDLCWYHANRVRPALDYREKEEAYMANCKANYTAGSPPPPRGSKNTNQFNY